MENRIGVKRSWPPYLFNIVVVLFSLWKGLSHISIISQILWFVLCALASATLIGFAFNKNYIDVKDGQLIVHRGLLQKSVIDIDQIEKIEIVKNPFKPSLIWLRNQQKVGFNEGLVNIENLRELLKSLGIPTI